MRRVQDIIFDVFFGSACFSFFHKTKVLLVSEGFGMKEKLYQAIK